MPAAARRHVNPGRGADQLIPQSTRGVAECESNGSSLEQPTHHRSSNLNRVTMEHPLPPPDLLDKL